MHIAFINSEYPSLSGQDHGGIATYIYTMANALFDAGHQVSILARVGTTPDSLNPGISFFTFNNDPPRGVLSPIQRIMNSSIYWERSCSKAALNCALQLHKTSRIDIIEIPEYNGLASEFIGPLPFSVVITFHTPTLLIDELNHTAPTASRKKMYSYERRALKKAVAFRCPSNSLAKIVSERFAIPLQRIAIIPNPISTAPFTVVEKKQPKADTACEILFSGRLERRKGAELMLRTIDQILSISPSVNVSFAGATEMGESANYREGIERSVSKEKRTRLWFLGPQHRSNLITLYRRSDIFLIPSLFENSPYSLLEAMAAGLPVVGADTSGIREIIRHNDNGLLFPLDKPHELCKCLSSLVESVERRTSLGASAKEYVRTRHHPDFIARETISFYEDIKAPARP